MENGRSEKDFGEDKQCGGVLEYKIICKKKACERISHRSSIFNAL